MARLDGGSVSQQTLKTLAKARPDPNFNPEEKLESFLH